MAYVWCTLVRACPHDRIRIVAFALVAITVTLAPGLFLRRLLRVRATPSNPFLEITFVVASSLCASALLVWTLYSFGYYTRRSLMIGLAAMAVGGLYGLRGIQVPRSRLASTLASLGETLRLPEWLAILVGGLFVQGLFERVVGTPMVSWDALVSWDKWAADAGVREGLGRYAMGGYPQFLPCLGSVFYKLADSGADLFPIEHLLLHGFYVQFVALLVISLLALGRTLNIPAAIILCLYMGSRLILEMTTGLIGSVDIPFAAMLAATCAVCAAYCTGAWGPTRQGWRSSVALFLPLLSTSFMKGNGLPLVAVVVVAMCCAVGEWRAIRRICASFLATLAILLPYLGHQVWYGAMRMDLAEQDPFLRSHTFRVAHTKEFSLSVGHFWMWIDRVGASYGVTMRFAALLLVVGCAVFCIRAAREGRLRFFAVVGPVSLALWFFTGSYDFRNAAAPLLMILIAATGVLWSGRTLETARTRRYAVRGLLVAAALCCLHNIVRVSTAPSPAATPTGYLSSRSAPPALFSMPFRAFRPPKIAMLPDGRRHMGVRPWGDIREILFNAPFGQRATHLLAADGLYRVLAPKGVFMMHRHRYNEQRRFDVALGEPYLNPPEQYEKVARLRRVRPYNVAVRLFEPEFQPVAMRLGDPSNRDVRDVVLKAGDTRRIQFAGDDGDSRQYKEGIVSLQVSPAGAPATLRLVEEDASRDPYAAYFESVKEGAEVRLLYWMNDELPVLPEFLLNVGSNDIRIVSAEWGR
jgi:hypothetical protein